MILWLQVIFSCLYVIVVAITKLIMGMWSDWFGISLNPPPFTVNMLYVLCLRAKHKEWLQETVSKTSVLKTLSMTIKLIMFCTNLIVIIINFWVYKKCSVKSSVWKAQSCTFCYWNFDSGWMKNSKHKLANKDISYFQNARIHLKLGTSVYHP